MDFSKLLGWIPPADRTKEQEAAHEAALASMPAFAMAEPFRALPKGEKVILSARWKDPKVVADVGFTFERFHQLTGSCVGASFGNACFTLAAVQRVLNETKAFVPYWLFNYGRGRFLAGFRGKGEGSIVSSQGKQALNEGVLVDQGPAMPDFQQGDGLTVSSQSEMTWSDGSYSAAYIPVAKVHPIGTVAPANDAETIYQGIVNGAPYHYGCDLFVGHAGIKGSGTDAYVAGKFDTRGGHATSLLGVWEHPTDGPLFCYQNNWPASVYPRDPNGLAPPCSVWIPLSEVDRGLKSLGMKNEGFLYSHLNWFPSQVEQLLDYVY